ncbi:MAG: pyridoxamine 5'-phosphate oxidase [bacterium]
MKRLNENDLYPDPIRQFQKWFAAARREKRILQPEAFCLATLSPDGFPAGRMLLLKSCDAEGFTFFTNFRSVKGKSLQACPKAAMNFFWEPLGRQVRIVGKAEPVSAAESDAYFQSRPRLSQIGAWASHQSEVLKNRRELERRFSDYRGQFSGKSVPRPPHWGGYRLVPKEIEFWQARPNRLHDRFLYRLQGKAWKIYRLNP